LPKNAFTFGPIRRMFKRARHSAGEDESGGHRTADAAGAAVSRALLDDHRMDVSGGAVMHESWLEWDVAVETTTFIVAVRFRPQSPVIGYEPVRCRIAARTT
jgi:hypothetical protein